MASVGLSSVYKVYSKEATPAIELVHNWAKDMNAEKSDREFALEDISLDISDGEFLCVVGPSGCGKSTLLKIIAGLEKVSSGTVTLDGQVVNDLEARQRGVGLVFQDYALYPHMESEDDMTFSFRVKHRSKEEMEKNLARTIEILGVGTKQLLRKKPSSLSGGQKQRVALGRCMIKDPPVFLLDEPLSNLDAKLRESVRYELKQLHRLLGTTIVYVTHDQQEAVALGDRIAVLNEGKLVQIDTPRGIFNKPANLFVAGFLGTPPMNFLECAWIDAQLVGEGFRLRPQDTLAAALDAILDSKPAKRFVLGIRPEHLLLNPPDTANQVRGTLTKIEPLMPKSILHVSVGNEKILMKADFAAEVSIGDEIAVGFQMERAVIFEKDTEQAVP